MRAGVWGARLVICASAAHSIWISYLYLTRAGFDSLDARAFFVCMMVFSYFFVIVALFRRAFRSFGQVFFDKYVVIGVLAALFAQGMFMYLQGAYDFARTSFLSCVVVGALAVYSRIGRKLGK